MYPSSDSFRVNAQSQSSTEDAQGAEVTQTVELENEAGDSQEPEQDEDTVLQLELIEDNAYDAEPETTTCFITPEDDYSNGFCFTISEDSFVLPENSYTPVQNSLPTSYSNSKELHISVEDSSPQDPLSSCLIFSDSVQALSEDFFASNGEESSMDSGLGSVESVYPTSEDDAASSPIYFKNEDDVVTLPALNENKITEHSVVTLTRLSKDTELSHIYPDTSSNTDAEATNSVDDCQGGSLIKEDMPTPILACNSMKRHIEETGDNGDGPSAVGKVRRKAKRVNFQDVTVFYFPRKQGFVSVPSAGGSTLGMAMNHTEFSTMTLKEHGNNIRERHEAKLREHAKEQRLAKEMLQLQYMNQGYQNNTMPTVSQSNYSPVEDATAPSIDGVDEYFFLQPITAKKRRKMLRSAGVERIDGEEKLANRLLRESRELCGCRCEEICLPESCECSLAGIQCQVDRESFPCGCIASGCQNENGRIEFNPERVRSHLQATLEKLNKMENEEYNEKSEEDPSSDSDQSTNSSESEDGSASLTASIAAFAQNANRVSPQCFEPSYHLPENLLSTLQLQRIDEFIHIDAENSHCNILEYATPQSLLSSNHGSRPVVRVLRVDAAEETFLEGTPTTAERLSSELWQGQDIPMAGQVKEMLGSDGVFSPTVKVTDVLNESHPDVKCDLTVPLDPIDTFLSSSFVSSSDIGGALNSSNSF